jgi:hypothetical protein
MVNPLNTAVAAKFMICMLKKITLMFRPANATPAEQAQTED